METQAYALHNGQAKKLGLDTKDTKYVLIMPKEGSTVRIINKDSYELVKEITTKEAFNL